MIYQKWIDPGALRHALHKNMSISTHYVLTYSKIYGSQRITSRSVQKYIDIDALRHDLKKRNIWDRDQDSKFTFDEAELDAESTSRRAIGADLNDDSAVKTWFRAILKIAVFPKKNARRASAGADVPKKMRKKDTQYIH